MDDGRRSSHRARLPADPALARHWTPASRLEFWLATDDGPRRVRVAPAAGGRLHPGRAARGRATSVLRGETRLRTARTGADRLPAPAGAGPVLPPATASCWPGKAPARARRRRLRGRRAPARALPDGALHHARRCCLPARRRRTIRAAARRPAEARRRLPPARCAPVSLDIETTMHGELRSIALEGCGQRQVYMLGPPNGDAARGVDFDLEYCDTAPELLDALEDWFARHDPDAIIGWNVVAVRPARAAEARRALRRPLRLGRDGSADGMARARRRQEHLLRRHRRAAWSSTASRRCARPPGAFPSFSLEIGGAEPAGRGQGRSTIPTTGWPRSTACSTEDKPALARYNLKDCELVTRIFEKTSLMAFLLERASVTGLAADRSGGSVAAFEHSYMPLMHRQGFVAPNIGDVAGARQPRRLRDGFALRPVRLGAGAGLQKPVPVDHPHLPDRPGRPGGGPATSRRTRHGAGLSRRALLAHAGTACPASSRASGQGATRPSASSNAPLSQALKIIMNAFYGVLGTTGLPLLRSAPGLVDHAARPRDHAPHARADRGAGLPGDLRRHRLDLRLARARARATRRPRASAARWSTTSTPGGARTCSDELGLESALELEYDDALPALPDADHARLGRGQQEALRRPGAQRRTAARRWSTRAWRRCAPTGRRWRRQFQQGLYERIFQRRALRGLRARLRGAHPARRAGRPAGLPQAPAPAAGRVRAQRAAARARGAHRPTSSTWRQGRPPQYQNGGWIRYVMTTAGPEPLEVRRRRARAPIDYEHYLTQPAGAGGRRHPAVRGRQFRAPDQSAGRAVLTSFPRWPPSQDGIFPAY